MGPMNIDPQLLPDQTLLETLSSASYTFLQPTQQLHATTLAHAKRYIDPIARTTSQLQEDRLQLLRKKRKRGQSDQYDAQNFLRLKQLHLDGFSIEQIWEQARRALNANRVEIERSLRSIHPVADQNGSLLGTSLPSSKDLGPQEKKSVHFRDEEEGARGKVDNTDDEDVEVEDFHDETDEEEMEIDGESEFDESALDGSDQGAVNDDFDEDYDSEANGFETPPEEPSETFVPDKNGLNDGFFSIDDFNRQAEFLEQRDAQGQDDGAASDEEAVDWDANPLGNGAASRSNEDPVSRENGESDDDEDGPTFGNADDMSDEGEGSASEGDMELADPGSLSNTNSVRYADFFEPPPRKASKKSRNHKSHPKTLPPPKNEEEQEADMQRTMAAVRRDIFEDDLTPDEDEEPSDPEERRSSHQKRQAALAAEIRRLEAAAIQKRDWTLSGEARAADRPLNSLLEEDLEFERVGKPVPVITQEVSEDIESLIKRRILAREFDEVIRRRPGNLATGGGKDGQRRGMFELSDAKPEQSLAEIYETEHLQRVDPDGHPTKADQKLEAEHKKIEAMWKDVSAKLDALSSWHYRPKPPSAEVTVVADVPAISMEDARPAGVGGDVGAESMLAPQEIYKAGESRNKAKEVVTSGGLPVGRAEMTREEKLRRRRREKERIRKRGEGIDGKNGQAGSKKAEKKREIVTDLEKGGVKVISKKGDIRDVHGNAIKNQQLGKGAGGYKL